MHHGAGAQTWGLALLRGCTDKEVARFMARADWLDVPAGHVLVREGELTKEFYVLLVGQATVRRGGRIVAELGPGVYCGELAILDPAPRSATVVMDTAGTVLAIGQREFLALLEEMPTVSRRLLNGLAHRLRVLDAAHAGGSPG